MFFHQLTAPPNICNLPSYLNFGERKKKKIHVFLKAIILRGSYDFLISRNYRPVYRQTVSPASKNHIKKLQERLLKNIIIIIVIISFLIAALTLINGIFTCEMQENNGS